MASETTALLAKLVSIPSVNPMGRALDADLIHESRMTDFLESWFRERGLACRRDPVAPGRDNLIARYDAPGSSRLILFDVHQDTVPVDGMTIDPFNPVIEGGCLHGRGSCDVKGSMAAMMTAFERLTRERPPGSASVVLVFTVDEEFTHMGATRLAESRLGASLAVVAEPTALDLVDCHKGALRWLIRTTGTACHSSNPSQGANAIYRMAAVVRVLEEHARALEAGTPDPALGPPTLSVGRIKGGQSVNTVPDECTIEVDRRLVPGETVLDAMGAVRAALDHALGRPDWLEFEKPWVSMPPLESAAGAFLQPLQAAVAHATGRKPKIRGVPFGTDAGPLGASGVPCVVFGPGDIAQAHTKDEWIELDQVDQAALAYYQIALELGR